MDHIQIHPRLSSSFHNYQNESLRQMVYFFLDFLENQSDADSQEAEDLTRIAAVAHKAEDIIEVQAAYLIQATSPQQSPTFLPDLQYIIEDMDSVKEEVIKVKEKTGFINRQPAASSPSATSKTSSMVGFEGYLEQLLGELTGHQSDRRILPILGMGGIGKTTLARNVYQNLLIVEHFYVRAWVTVSQQFSARDILLQALSCLEGSTGKMDKTDDQLGEELYKILVGRRYLVVLDDVWNVEAWEEIKFFFPENNNRSRIVITTRQFELVDYFGSSVLALNFLDDQNSWDLFCEHTFAQENCPPELEEVGKRIVDKCKGLPLAIVVIAGLLGKSSRTPKYWEKIVMDKSLVLDSGEGTELLSILYLSYKHLPVWLKSCFLYLGLFPEDHRIDVPKLIKLWVAEGFIESNAYRSLEETAESYIEDLVDRNLLLVGHLELNKKIGTCYIHDLVRELCIRIAEKENFYCVQRDIDGRRHFIVDERSARFYPLQSYSSETPSLIRPLIFNDGQRVAPFKSRLLRVYVRHLDDLALTFGEVNLRFLSHDSRDILSTIRTYKLPSSISLLWSLETLIVGGIFTVVAPSEIWKMPQLRHIQMWGICLPDPPPNDDVFVLQNLQTLETVKDLILTEEVCKIIPNIKKLGIDYNFDEASWCHHLHNFGRLNKLVSLRYCCSGLEYIGNAWQNLRLPSSLKELSLEGCRLVWSDMAMIASLPHLEILKLQENAVVGGEWNCVEDEEEFLCLKHLEICRCDDLIYWIADTSNFPVLETLCVVSLQKLEEIPSGIGEIPTLERMEISQCSESTCISAVKIAEELESFGNESLHLQLEFRYESEAEMWRGKIEELGITCQNLHISGLLR